MKYSGAASKRTPSVNMTRPLTKIKISGNEDDSTSVADNDEYG
jgi:hypothetical protein